MRKSTALILMSFTLTVGFVIGQSSRAAPVRANAANKAGADGAFVTWPTGDGKRVAQSLVVTPGADPDAAWYIEVAGAVYLCTPR